MYGSYHLWCGNHWQPISYDPKQEMCSAHDNQTVEKSTCENCHHQLCDTKDLLEGVTSLRPQYMHTSSGQNVLQQYKRCLKSEEKLVELFDSTVTITAKEDLLHSLR